MDVSADAGIYCFFRSSRFLRRISRLPLFPQLGPLLGRQPLAGADLLFGQLCPGVEQAALLQLFHGAHPVAQAHARHPLHDVGHAVELLHELVDFVRLDAGPGGNPPAAALVDHLRGISPFVGGHGVDDAPQAAHALLGIHIPQHLRHAAHARQHAQNLVDRAELARLPQHLLEIVQGKLAFAEPGLLLGHLLLVELLLRLLDQRKHVAHAENSTGHAVGVKLLQGVEVLARADKLDRHAGDRLDRQRGAAPGVAVELGHDHAVKLQRLVERLGAVDGVLAGHRVDHQVHLVGADAAIDGRKLIHQFGVDVQPAGRVEDHHVGPGRLRLFHRGLTKGHRIGGTEVRVYRQAELLADHLQLLNGSGPLQVGRCQHRLAAVPQDGLAQLAAGGRLAGPLKAAEHQHRHVAPQMERMVYRAHQVDQFLVDDVDQLIGRVEGFQHRLADGLFAHPGHEILDHRQADVGLQQGPLHQLQPVAHVRLGESCPVPAGPVAPNPGFLAAIRTCPTGQEIFFRRNCRSPPAAQRRCGQAGVIPYLTNTPPPWQCGRGRHFGRKSLAGSIAPPKIAGSPQREQG